jgi:hypothetical protein
MQGQLLVPAGAMGSDMAEFTGIVQARFLSLAGTRRHGEFRRFENKAAGGRCGEQLGFP